MPKRKLEESDLSAPSRSVKRTKSNDGNQHILSDLRQQIMKGIQALNTLRQTFDENVKDIAIEKKESELRKMGGNANANVDAIDVLTDELTSSIINFDQVLHNIHSSAEKHAAEDLTIPLKLLQEYDGPHSTSFSLGVVEKLIKCEEDKNEAGHTNYLFRTVKSKSLKLP